MRPCFTTHDERIERLAIVIRYEQCRPIASEAVEHGIDDVIEDDWRSNTEARVVLTSESASASRS